LYWVGNKRFLGGEVGRCLILYWKKRRGREKSKREKGAFWMSKGGGKLMLKRKRKKTSAFVLTLKGKRKRLGGEMKTSVEGGKKTSEGRKKRKGERKICEILKFASGKNRIGGRKKRERRERHRDLLELSGMARALPNPFTGSTSGSRSSSGATSSVSSASHYSAIAVEDQRRKNPFLVITYCMNFLV
jgi:hypothetical protein